MYDLITNSDINSLEPWTPYFWPCHTLDWLYTVPITNKVDVKPTIYRSGLASFKMTNELINSWSLGTPLLPLLEISNNVSSSQST